MTLAPSYSVAESIINGKLAQVYVEQRLFSKVYLFALENRSHGATILQYLKTHLV